jgi:hypothetical protein
MPFFLDGNPTQGEISEAVNYLLGNFSQNVTADPATGQITGPTGEISGYLYKYMYVKYADSFDGTLNFSNVPTNRKYYGLRNSDSSSESTNPADYVWYKLDPTIYPSGFGTVNFLFYLTTGGRQIQFQISTTVPNPGWIQDPGSSIDLDVTAITNSVANFVVIRVPNNSAAPTDAECIAAIGRTPISGDLCTVNYNSGIYSIVYKYTTGWAIFQKYITGDLIVANTITASNIAASTITANEIASNTITAAKMVTGTITAASAILANASVDTLQIAGNAVIVPSASTGSGTGGCSVTLSLASGNTVFISGYIGSATGVNGDRTSVLKVGSTALASLTIQSVLDTLGTADFFPTNLSVNYTIPSTGSYTFSISYTGSGVVGTSASAIQVLGIKR